MVSTQSTLDRMSAVSGYSSFDEMLKEYFIPVGTTVILTSILIPYIMAVPWWSGFIIAALGIAFLVGYPYSQYIETKQSIERNLHYFITYAGTISTVDIPRTKLFRKISENENFGYISDVFSRIHYLAKDWNLGYAHATREMSEKVPSPILADFLDRFAVALDFGESISTFLAEEQESIMEDFRVEYEKSLETIELIQDTFVALSISFSFVLGTTLLAPLLLDVQMTTILPFAIGFILMVDIGLIAAVRSYIPTDRLIHNFDKRNRDQQQIFLSFCGACLVGVLLFILIYFLTSAPFLLTLAISVSPLAVPGFLALRYENRIVQRDKEFPIYSRVLGSAIEVRDGAVVSALKSTQVHDFGALDDMSVHLYRRLRIGSDRWESWHYLALESGSTLISNFSKIFSESVYMGGNSQRIGEIVSENMQELLSLRKLRSQLANGLRGSFYGTLIGLSSVIYITAKVAELLIGIFNQPLGLETSQFNFAATIIPQAQSIDFTMVFFYIGLLIIVHSAASSFIMKAIDGGSWYAASIDFIIMIWIGAALSIFLPVIIDGLLPDIQSFGNNTTAANATG
jgi:flagellar protein FlaJ